MWGSLINKEGQKLYEDLNIYKGEAIHVKLLNLLKQHNLKFKNFPSQKY